jgi:hypothetical protein
MVECIYINSKIRSNIQNMDNLMINLAECTSTECSENVDNNTILVTVKKYLPY